MQTITNELAGLTDRPMQLIGLNMSQYSTSGSSLAGMTGGRSLPWLRCDPMNRANDPSKSWAIPIGGDTTRAPLYRELVVLNHRNEVVLTFDLSAKPIDGPSHADQRALVKEALRTAAALPDTDGDRLPDAWEIDQFGNTNAVTSDSPTPSGMTALLAYAIGQSPHAGDPARAPRLVRSGNSLSLTYTRRLDRRPALVWTVQQFDPSAGWEEWVGPTPMARTTQFDGTGTERITHSLPVPAGAFEAWRLFLQAGSDPGN